MDGSSRAPRARLGLAGTGLSGGDYLSADLGLSDSVGGNADPGLVASGLDPVIRGANDGGHRRAIGRAAATQRARVRSLSTLRRRLTELGGRLLAVADTLQGSGLVVYAESLGG